MKLHILGSSSHGNCYLLESSTGTLVVEAGVKFSEVKKAMDFQIGKIVGAVISHKHDDHAKYIGEIISNGILALASRETLVAKNLYGSPFTREIMPMKGVKVSDFRIMPIPLSHTDSDGTPCGCLGFVIDHHQSGRILFATDTWKIDTAIPRLNHILIEANYSDEILDSRIESGDVPYAMRKRLLFSHMEIGSTRKTLLANDLSGVSEIILIHLSDGNSNARSFAEIICSATGKPTLVAEKGMVLSFSSTPY